MTNSAVTSQIKESEVQLRMQDSDNQTAVCRDCSSPRNGGYRFEKISPSQIGQGFLGGNFETCYRKIKLIPPTSEKKRSCGFSMVQRA